MSEDFQRPTDDLFGQQPGDDSLGNPFSRETDCQEDSAGNAFPAPETLPLIREEPERPCTEKTFPAEELLTQGAETTETKKTPLIFSTASPVSGRSGETSAFAAAGGGYPPREHRDFLPLAEDAIPSGAEIGEILRLGREAAGYTPEETARLTHIALHYLLALEEDDSEFLPPPVYVSAYLRTLGKLYRFPPEISNRVRELHLKHLPANDLSVALLRRINRDALVNEEEGKRVTILFTSAVIVAGVAVLIGIWAIILAVLNAASTSGEADLPAAAVAESLRIPPSASVSFDPNRFKELTPEPVCDLHVLKMSSAPSVRRN